METGSQMVRRRGVLSMLLQGLGEGTPHISSAPTQGHPSHRRSASPCFATESVCTTP